MVVRVFVPVCPSCGMEDWGWKVFGPDWGGDDLRRLRCGNCGHNQEPLTAVITVGDREMPGVPS